jgi:hypothetical protein
MLRPSETRPKVCAMDANFRSFLGAFSGQWFAIVSGGFGVPLTVASVFMPTAPLQAVAAVVGVAGMIVAAYRIWKKERDEVIRRRPVVNYDRDTPLREAVFFIVHGRWLGETETALEGTGQTTQAINILGRMRELAGDGKLQIWGTLNKWRLHELVDKSFWIDHQIDFLTTLASNDQVETKTEKTTPNASPACYEDLMVSKAQIESLRTSSTQSPKSGPLFQSAAMRPPPVML